ncbi:MAG: hypothetical protein M1813_008700 [Trichoglossum hirsutum]|nr:MAG: hypothetical protein M1813_008700 [Trichoglossum hirsutum]
MLENFHGFQHADEHRSSYEPLNVQKDIDEGKVKPGQNFVLKFDFSRVNRCPDVKSVDRAFKAEIYESLKEFCRTYAKYLGEDALGAIDRDEPEASLRRCIWLANEVITRGDKRIAGVKGIYFLVDEYDAFSNHYLEPYKAVTWESTEIEETFRAFWAVTKSLLRSGIKRVFVTGISPLSMSGVLSGFNVTTNLSLDRDLAGLCGLTISDIQTALKILWIAN